MLASRPRRLQATFVTLIFITFCFCSFKSASRRFRTVDLPVPAGPVMSAPRPSSITCG